MESVVSSSVVDGDSLFSRSLTIRWRDDGHREVDVVGPEVLERVVLLELRKVEEEGVSAGAQREKTSTARRGKRRKKRLT